MDATGWAMVIGAVFAGLCSLLTTGVAGFIAYQQWRMKAKIDADALDATQVRKAQGDKIDKLEVTTEKTHNAVNSKWGLALQAVVVDKTRLAKGSKDPADHQAVVEAQNNLDAHNREQEEAARQARESQPLVTPVMAVVGKLEELVEHPPAKGTP